MAYANNHEKARALFVKRSYYKDKFDSSFPEYIDFNDKRYFYGRVDHNFDPIVVRNERMKAISQNSGPEVYALDFVVDAFEDMKRYLSEALMRTRGDKLEGTFIQNMIAHKAWVNPNALYGQHLTNTTRIYAVNYLERISSATWRARQEDPIVNIDDYVDTFLRFYGDAGYPYPLTKSNFTLSGYVSPNCSGLCIEIDAAEHGNDQYKVSAYYDNPAFSDYVKVARRFGFVIDKNAPWRLVANIASPIMKNYMEFYGVKTRPQFFKHYYLSVVDYDIEALKRYFVNQYNAYVTDSPTTTVVTTVHCSNGPITVSKEVAREPAYYMPDRGDGAPVSGRWKALTDSFWVDRYYRMRHTEAAMYEVPDELEAGIKRALFLQKTVDTNAAVRYISDKTKTTYRRYTMPPPTARSLFGVTCCVPSDPATAPVSLGDEWSLAPSQNGLTPHIVPTTRGPGLPDPGGTD